MEPPEVQSDRLRYEAICGVVRNVAFAVAAVTVGLLIASLFATPAHGAEPRTDQEAMSLASKTGKPLVFHRLDAAPKASGAIVYRASLAEINGLCDPWCYLYTPRTGEWRQLDPARVQEAVDYVVAFDAKLREPPPAPVYYAPQPSVIGNLRSAFFGGS